MLTARILYLREEGGEGGGAPQPLPPKKKNFANSSLISTIVACTSTKFTDHY